MRGRRVLRGLLGTFGVFAALALLLVGAARPAAAAQDGDSVTVEMDEYDGSGISGTAVLTDTPDGLLVEMTLEGDIVGAHPSHFHEGDCGTMDPLVPIYPLADVDEDGTSVTTVPDITVADITAVPYVINVHASLAELPVIVTCGNVPVLGKSGDDDAAGADDDAEGGVGGGVPSDMPQAGVGSALASGGADMMVVSMLGALAVVLAVAGVMVRRAERQSGAV